MGRKIKPLKWKITKNNCHEIISHSLIRGGYVQIIRNGILYIAHRYIWEKMYGPISKGLCVLHSCDNLKCINPEHLFLGTNYDNTQDMIKKGRAHRKSRKGDYKLTIEEDEFIRSHYKKINSRRSNVPALGVKFNVCDGTIRKIIKRKR